MRPSAFLTLATVFTAVAARALPPEPAPKNILLIAVDDLNTTLGCYGDKRVRTPAIDALAARGVVFERAYCAWPVCGPSRAALLTGRRPEHAGVTDLKTDVRHADPGVVTLPQRFRAAGYATAAVGKVFDPRCCDDGHDRASWSVPYAEIPHAGVYKEGRAVTAAPKISDAECVDGAIGAQGRELLGRLAAGKKPFFLAVGFKKPHLPFVAPAKYWSLYDRAQFSPTPNAAPVKDDSGYNRHDSEELRGYDGVPASGPIPAAAQAEYLHGYHACVSQVDARVGELLDDLRRLGLEKNTVVVLLGDQGFHLGDHSLWGKHSVLEAAARAPLLIAAPGVRPGVCRSPVEFTDLYPTLCELGALVTPPGLDGKSLKPILDGRVAAVRPGAVTVFKKQGCVGYSYRTDRYRYTAWVNKAGKTVATDLFDYRDDPGETRNRGSDPAFAELRARLDRELRADAAGCLRLTGEDSPVGAKDEDDAPPPPKRAGAKRRAASPTASEPSNTGPVAAAGAQTASPPVADSSAFPDDAFWARFGTPHQLRHLPELRKLLAEPTAPAWRTEARRRIAQTRQVPVALKLVDASGRPIPDATVSLRQTNADFRFGGIINHHHWLGDRDGVDGAAYRSLFKQCFNAAGFENALKIKWLDEAASIRPIVDELVAAGIPVRGHLLIWPGWKKLPENIVALKDKPDALRAACDAMMVKLIRAWPQVEEWDVVNEPRTSNDVAKLLGRDIYAHWYRLARRECKPGTGLYLNDFQIISGTNPKFKDFYEQLARELLAAKAPLTGLGFQSRFRAHLPPDEVMRSLDRFAALGLPIKGTEFEVIDDGGTVSDEERARITEEVLINYYACPAARGLYVWSFFKKGDALALPNGQKNWGYTSHFVERDGTLNLNALVWIYYTQHAWRTRAELRADARGVTPETRVFSGDYTAEVRLGGRTATLPVRLAAPGVITLTVR